MDYFPEGSLTKYFDETRVFGEKEGLAIISQCADGLRALAKEHIAHCDLTPSNILVRKDDGKLTFVIADLGCATDLQKAHPTACGTHAFAAPESLAPHPSFNENSDVFSLAMVVVFYLLGRKHPYNLAWNTLPADMTTAGRSAQFSAVYEDRGEFKFSTISPTHSQCSPTFINLLLKMLRFNPKERISADRVFAIASDPARYERATDRFEQQFLAAHRLSTGLEEEKRKLSTDLDRAILDCQSSGRQLHTTSTALREMHQQLNDANDHLKRIADDKLYCEQNLNVLQCRFNDLTTRHDEAIVERDAARAALLTSETECDAVRAAKMTVVNERDTARLALLKAETERDTLRLSLSNAEKERESARAALLVAQTERDTARHDAASQATGELQTVRSELFLLKAQNLLKVSLLILLLILTH